MQTLFYSLLLLLISSCSTSPVHKIDKEGIRSTFSTNTVPLRNCYEGQLKENPNFEGKVMLEFNIGPKGKVMSSKVDLDKSSLKNDDLHKCLLKELNTLTFPAPQTSKEVNVIYPLTFSRKK